MEEIKQSFNLKYIVFFVFFAILGGAITYFIDYYKEISNENVLNISLSDGANQVSREFDSDIIEANYILKNDSSLINSFFYKKIVVTNTGNKGLENIDLVINTNDPNISLLKKPSIETEPTELKEFLKIDYKYNSDCEHTLSIPLLNKNESIIIGYKAYSEKIIDFFDLNAYVHQKDLKIQKANLIRINDEDLYLIAKERMWLLIVSVVLIISSFLLYLLITQRNQLKEIKLERLFEVSEHSQKKEQEQKKNK